VIIYINNSNNHTRRRQAAFFSCSGNSHRKYKKFQEGSLPKKSRNKNLKCFFPKPCRPAIRSACKLIFNSKKRYDFVLLYPTRAKKKILQHVVFCRCLTTKRFAFKKILWYNIFTENEKRMILREGFNLYYVYRHTRYKIGHKKDFFGMRNNISTRTRKG